MSVSAFDSAMLGGLLGDGTLGALLDDRARIRAMLQVEVALARVQGELGIIPEAAGVTIAATAVALEIEPAELAAGTAKDGVPVPTLVKALRKAVGAPHADHVHFGATSQDIVDTALVLTIAEVLEVIAGRLHSSIELLAALAERHAATIMAGRTRFQLASPTTFGLKAAGWAAPLRRHLDRLAELRPRLAVVSLAGASGNPASLGERGGEVEAALARELGLGVAIAPWHAARDTVAELAGWLSLVTGSLAKIGLDVLLLAQNEVGEVRPGSGGGSSTMPHKANPVAGEVLVALARSSAERVAAMHHALLHAHERDGSAWLAEWLNLPDLLVAAGAASRTALTLLQDLVVDAEAMTERATAAPGLLFSEPAVFALAAVMPRGEAEAQVAAAAKTALAEGRHLVDVLAESLGPVVDWPALRRLDGTVAAATKRTRAIVQALRAP
ncbi:3-carboxy-cis,cis-muconate cycloisomerase [Geminicoccus harenae]|uniref:3-carboxy-cis,cis-muconate cycloisomerase n=1 Tax=Geminicoccus harenae TaxID=2498453 RepID=UPI00168B048F|nr:3-carboxy-cis,cis-muconate cycloisomerase [Geminicoccus harenae]